MPSLRSRLISLYLRRTRKRAFASAEELNRWIAWPRATQTHRPPTWIRQDFIVTEEEVDGRSVYRLEPGRIRADRHILYLHGGAFCFEMTSHHWNFVAGMAQRLGAAVTVPIYPLAPEARFEEIFGFAGLVHDRLLEQVGPTIVMGDSAGANMAVVLTMMAGIAGRPRAGRLVLVSPSLDMTMDNPELVAMEAADPWLGIAGGLEAIRLYAGHMDRRDWRISPILGDLSHLPPTLILAGTNDMLTPDAVRFAARAREAGAEVEIDVEPGMIHVWPLMPIPEARRARERIARYLDGHWS